MKKHQSLTLLLLLFSTAPSSVWAGKIDPQENKVTVPGLLSVWGDGLKEKNSKYDLAFKVKNESDKWLLFYFGSMNCFKGTAEGELIHSFFHIGSRTIKLKPRQLRSFGLTCKVGESVKGDHKVVIHGVYEATPTTAEPGKKILEELVWVAEGTKASEQKSTQPAAKESSEKQAAAPEKKEEKAPSKE